MAAAHDATGQMKDAFNWKRCFTGVSELGKALRRTLYATDSSNSTISNY